MAESMHTWKVQLADGTDIKAAADQIEVSSAGALVFRNVGEDVPVRILAPDVWIEVQRVVQGAGEFT